MMAHNRLGCGLKVNPVANQLSLLLAWFTLDLEDGSNSFCRNVCEVTPDYKESRLRRCITIVSH